jgi:DNA-binding IclR family transcriptional regulator
MIDKEPVVTKALSRSAKILTSMSSGNNRLTDIANDVGLETPVANRLLKTLVALGLALQDSVTRRYYLGPLITKLSVNYEAIHRGLVLCAIDDMEKLWKSTEETISLSIQIGNKRLCIEELSSPQTITQSLKKGFTANLYGATGRVLLSQLDPWEQKLILNSIPVITLANKTILNPEIFKWEIDLICAQGYAISSNELTLGGAALSVPIYNYNCPCALTVLCPENRFSNVMKRVEEIKIAGTNISEKLLIWEKHYNA